MLGARVGSFVAVANCRNAAALGQFRAQTSSGKLVNASSLGFFLTTPDNEMQEVAYPVLVCRSSGQVVLDRTIAVLIENLLRVSGVWQVNLYQTSKTTRVHIDRELEMMLINIFGPDGIPRDNTLRRELLRSRYPRLAQRVEFYRR